MELLIPIVIVVLLIAGFVTFLVMNSMKKSGPVAEGEQEGAPGIGADETPLGDTTEHAGRQSDEGTTVGDQDADESGGTGRPVHSGTAGTSAAGQSAPDPDAAAHVMRPGEGEGKERLEFDGQRPSEAERSAAEPQPAGGGAPASASPGAMRAEPESDSPRAERSEPEGERPSGDERPASERLADRGV
jgi:hypothetical protein